MSNDSANCGACGTVCALVTLASGRAGPAAIAVDATNAYWTDSADGTVMKVPLDGGVPTLLASGQTPEFVTSFPTPIAVDATSVYWTNTHAVMKVALGGGAPTTLATGLSQPGAMAVDATNVYWTDGSAGAVMKVPLGGGTPVTLASVATTPNSIAVDGTSVYWTNTDGTVMKAPIGGGNALTLAVGQVAPRTIAVDATSVYWTNSPGAVMKLALAGGTPVALGAFGGVSFTMVVNATGIYSPTADKVMAMPLTGGTPVTLSTTNGAYSIAVAGTKVYWTDAGAVMSLGTCQSGTCKCPGSQLACFGKCVDTSTDSTNCGGCGVTCAPDTMCKGGSCLPVPPSCSGVASNCGPSRKESCCASPLVTGGTFYRSYDGVTSGYTSQAYPATVSDFRLDKFEVTVERFRKFVAAWNAGWRPQTGSGKHTHLNGGNGLANSAASGYETGWDPTWASNVAPTDTNLACYPAYQTWTSSVGGNERRPINCTTWYEQYAFCIWDGGFLPSEAEWNYAAAGGNEQRIYPWGAAPPDCGYSNFGGPNFPTTACDSAGPADVDYASPKGNGKYDQANLAGNVWERTLDRYVSPYVTSCADCSYLPASGPDRAVRHGSFGDAATDLPVSGRSGYAAAGRDSGIGTRCARPVGSVPSCTSPAVACGSSCVNLASDSANCGACNYPCLHGRTCTAGRCTPGWLAMSSTNAPAPRTRHAAGFVSGRFVVLGGAPNTTGVAMSSSAAYDPTTDSWQALPDLQAARCSHDVASTGSTLLTFGGLTDCSNGTTLGPALERYTPGSGWATVTGSNAPALRYNFATTWTGSELFVYGGSTNANPAIPSGALFSPSSTSWRDASCGLAGCERGGYFSAFVDAGFVRIWGGGPYGGAPAGLQYALASGVWSAWTVPAGTTTKYTQRYADAGARLYYIQTAAVSTYDKAAGAWLVDDSAAMPAGFCSEAAAAWTGSEVVAWSGSCSGSVSSVGGRYQPAAP
jgi:formylglycine-generating enzyme required for sulfatase activity